MSQTVRPEVATFVGAVRAHLSDLTPDEVEDLTGGLEADLDERLADAPGGTGLGDPRAYAEELRTAAGLPPRGAGGGRRAGPGLAARTAGRVHTLWTPVADAARRQPWWPQTRESVVALRPAWWLARAWVPFAVVTSSALPRDLGSLLLLLLLVGVSVAFGRGLLDERLGVPRRRWLQRLLVGLNVLAVLAVLPALSSARSGAVQVAGPYSEGAPPPSGLALDGRPVTNVFAYDAQGRPIPLVQLYDQSGRPLAVTAEESTDELGNEAFVDPGTGDRVAPWVDDRGRARWNAVPVPGVSSPPPTTDTNGLPAPGGPASATVPSPPLVAVPPIIGVSGVAPTNAPVPGSSPSAGPTSSPTSGPTSGPTPGPTASPTRTP